MQARIELEKTRLLVLGAADMIDRVGNKKARGVVAMAKVRRIKKLSVICVEPQYCYSLL